MSKLPNQNFRISLWVHVCDCTPNKVGLCVWTGEGWLEKHYLKAPFTNTPDNITRKAQLQLKIKWKWRCDFSGRSDGVEIRLLLLWLSWLAHSADLPVTTFIGCIVFNLLEWQLKYFFFTFTQLLFKRTNPLPSGLKDLTNNNWPPLIRKALMGARQQPMFRLKTVAYKIFHSRM